MKKIFLFCCSLLMISFYFKPTFSMNKKAEADIEDICNDLKTNKIKVSELKNIYGKEKAIKILKHITKQPKGCKNCKNKEEADIEEADIEDICNDLKTKKIKVSELKDIYGEKKAIKILKHIIKQPKVCKKCKNKEELYKLKCTNCSLPPRSFFCKVCKDEYLKDCGEECASCESGKIIFKKI
ncbi:hypothetical protein GF385_00195 [Candidatus Dependentiae bacterium]|nr:hypothetical protein [Candidatus Dependentiae bacterium]